MVDIHVQPDMEKTRDALAFALSEAYGISESRIRNETDIVDTFMGSSFNTIRNCLENMAKFDQDYTGSNPVRVEMKNVDLSKNDLNFTEPYEYYEEPEPEPTPDDGGLSDKQFVLVTSAIGTLAKIFLGRD